MTKTSCRACGTYLCPTTICTVCHEYIAWACPECQMAEDVTHVHDYCRVVNKEEITVRTEREITASS